MDWGAWSRESVSLMTARTRELLAQHGIAMGAPYHWDLDTGAIVIATQAWPSLTSVRVHDRRWRARLSLSGAPIVEAQHAAKPFSSHHRSVAVRRLCGCDDELVLESLTVPLEVVVRHELRHRPSEVAFAQRDDLPQALRLDRQNEAHS